MRNLLFFFFLVSILFPTISMAWEINTTEQGYRVRWCNKAIDVKINAEDQLIFDKAEIRATFEEVRKQFTDNQASSIDDAKPPFLVFKGYTDATTLTDIYKERHGPTDALLAIVFYDDLPEDNPYVILRRSSANLDICIDYAIIQINGSYRIGNGSYDTIDFQSLLTRALLEAYGIVPTNNPESVFGTELRGGVYTRELGEDDKEAMRALYPESGSCQHANAPWWTGLMPFLLLRRRRNQNPAF